MPIIYNDPKKRAKYDAFRVIDETKVDPLREAVMAALELRRNREILANAFENANPEDRAKLALAIAKATPDEIHAWIKIAEFVYTKPRAPLEVSGTLSLEQLLAGSWDGQQPQTVIPERGES